ncbi:MAG: (d)CMP kinase [Planctomycetes bacterium]|nr:(d)CMP kinase [Planctomycetota bacterium]
MIVTIDGPAGAGKSSAARMLAQRLGFDFLDTGAMYRAVTLAALRANCDLADQNALAGLLETIHLDMPPGRVMLNGENIADAIRTPAVTAASGPIASSPVVRTRLVDWQRKIADGRDFVCEGRDQGTIVFPHALCKFFLVADPLERARRRHRELTQRGDAITLEEIVKSQEERDARDAARDIAPMVPAPDAIQLDSTQLTLDEVVARMEQEVRARQPNRAPPLPPVAPISPGDPLARMDTAWFKAWHECLYLPYHLLFTLAFSIRKQGMRNMPWTGPALLISNHQSYLDPLIVGLVARRPLVYLARRTLFRNPYFGWMIRSMNAVPIDQEGIGLDGIRTILVQLQRGRPVLVFPEGRRTDDGAMLPLKPGVHLLIKRTQAPIVPVGIAGAYGAWPIWRKYPWPAPLFLPAGPGTISVSLGKPLDASRYAAMPREEALQELFDKIHTEQQRAENIRRK